LEIADISKEDLVYVDESGIDIRMHREYARSKRGVKVMADISGKRSARISLIAGRVENKIIAPLRFEGYTDSRVFETYLEKVLVPELKEGQTVIIDNASFHKSTKAREIIEEAKCTLKFLPAYSPDLNPIEKSWAHIKARIKKIKNNYDDINQAIDYAFIDN
jgi:isftu1 transposase